MCGHSLDERSVLRRFQKILAAADLPRMRIHDLRHRAVAILIAQGVNIKAISELLGHSSVAFTLQVYGHLMEETKKETAMKMDAALIPVATSVATKRVVRSQLTRKRLKILARPERLELPTYWFEASRSIHLSYGRAPLPL